MAFRTTNPANIKASTGMLSGFHGVMVPVSSHCLTVPIPVTNAQGMELLFIVDGSSLLSLSHCANPGH
ncbi:hypothetical protein RRG08_000021 [Elysia crispata]|uniref:Uncharacterized protein n=1 Tax=Elysia crispata TaxID=231223 RepID=A0AAE0Y5U1_9GAST|nr:hypothetical protein RRG08_000021 [Elysia crispata]